jgi:hypothetical protein
MKAAILTIALLLASASAYAQPSTGVSAVYHGSIVVKPSRGRLDRENGNAKLKVGPWPFKLSTGSNGIFPDQEAILIDIGDDPGFYLPAGTLRPIRKGRSFVYRAKRKTAGPRSVMSFRLDTQPDGTYIVRFKLRGLDLSRLLVEDPVCSPFAVIIGDDDGFSGVAITSPSFQSPRVAIPSDCDIGDAWPWIRN